MKRSEITTFNENTLFRTLSNNVMPFSQVFESIIKFIKEDTNCSYTISVGTDSQVAGKTVLVSCILVHRVGRGAIGFLHKSVMQRPIISLREKIYLETCASLQLAYLFSDEKIRRIQSVFNSNKKNSGVTFEFHIDIGANGKTKALINEMTGMVSGSGFIPKIKPESFCASSFADRHTKAM